MSILLNPDLQRRIAEKIESGRYGSVDEVVRRGLDLLEAQDASGTAPASTQNGVAREAEPIWEKVIRLGESIPKEAWTDVPTDLAKNWEHYRYGAPKESE